MVLPHPDYTIDEEGLSVEIVLTDNGEDGVTCTFYNTEAAVSTTPATLDVLSSSGALGCSGTAYITAIVRTSSGDLVPNGTVVVFSATIGSLSTTSAGTANGQATISYTAPAATGGTATISATSGSASDSVAIQVNCQPLPPAAPTLPPPVVVIQPPSTGDAGLAAAERPWLTAGLGLALLASLCGAGLALVRPR